ncbi:MULTISPECIES: WD40 repeat domain-containing protein [Aliivibrio]|uniref:WD40 repeat domain-containing protein n=1 Tax=Aliivibrio finisterrensis TaxID=511998 RepID=A0A4V1Z829_9GAMM|nr:MULTISPECIES: WD40 repeat domain-containing protein [Aliivibrio]MDD9180665.1 WD40 repeat domain-containing protein [Aliivibrio sp. A6]RYU47493.1 WD40 repeat domain-containing protein [Aliivibrio finisterrensis]RYU51345.1 WD40 repeat domain-containing protein [Aliivibrio finisterrensis]RYU53534.1 WD40 repeat domain-containing protein [Aliivibrio finisterrensis]RYU63910.1 WD40 repeat domain-containing protein [Aliivibrio finisterrensis]
MKKILLLVLFSITLMGCNDPESAAAEAVQLRAEQHPDRTYVGENNYYTMESSGDIQFTTKKDLKVMYQDFPRYFIEKAKEWPKEDLNDTSSYDLPRFQFAWANSSSKDEYESGLKIWSMKTDGTDLRLVTDATIGFASIRNLARSPNNRYVAWAGSGGQKGVYDLKTGKVSNMHKFTSPLDMLWSEDSRYLYFDDARNSYARWDSETGEVSDSDLKVRTEAVLTEDKIIKVTDAAVVGYNLKTNERLFVLSSDRSLSDKERIFRVKSISPTGRFAWGSNQSFAWMFDTKELTVKQMTTDYTPAQILGKDAHFSALDSFAKVRIVDRVGDRVWSWRAFYYGALSGDAILYNGLANNGLWFKEDK